MNYPNYDTPEPVKPNTNRQIALMAAVQMSDNKNSYFVLRNAEEFLKWLEKE